MYLKCRHITLGIPSLNTFRRRFRRVDRCKDRKWKGLTFHLPALSPVSVLTWLCGHTPCCPSYFRNNTILPVRLHPFKLTCAIQEWQLLQVPTVSSNKGHSGILKRLCAQGYVSSSAMPSMHWHMLARCSCAAHSFHHSVLCFVISRNQVPSQWKLQQFDPLLFTIVTSFGSRMLSVLCRLF